MKRPRRGEHARNPGSAQSIIADLRKKIGEIPKNDCRTDARAGRRKRAGKDRDFMMFKIGRKRKNCVRNASEAGGLCGIGCEFFFLYLPEN